MAAEGARFLQYYSASPVCSPSRAALLTGRYSVRTGVPSVLWPQDTYGLAPTETTIARVLKRAGYRTMCVGKWHVGSESGSVPTARGFDDFFGILHSNDMLPLPMLRRGEVVEETARQETLTRRFTEESIRFIRDSAGDPFFLYLAHTAPHSPLVPSPEFRGRSGKGLYADVIAELDWSVGEVLRTIRELKLDQDTLVLFTSDNGPWGEGSGGRLRGRKGGTLDGGMRVPLLAWMPGRIPEGRVVDSMAASLDLMPTIANLAGGTLPALPLDGIDIFPLMTGGAEVERPPFLYIDNWDIQCVRQGRWKLHVARANSDPFSTPPPGGRLTFPLAAPELYDVASDPGEAADRAAEFPDVVNELRASIYRVLYTLPVEAQQAWWDMLSRKPIK